MMMAPTRLNAARMIPTLFWATPVFTLFVPVLVDAADEPEAVVVVVVVAVGAVVLVVVPLLGVTVVVDGVAVVVDGVVVDGVA